MFSQIIIVVVVIDLIKFKTIWKAWIFQLWHLRGLFQYSTLSYNE